MQRLNCCDTVNANHFCGLQLQLTMSC